MDPVNGYVSSSSDSRGIAQRVEQSFGADIDQEDGLGLPCCSLHIRISYVDASDT